MNEGGPPFCRSRARGREQPFGGRPVRVTPSRRTVLSSRRSSKTKRFSGVAFETAGFVDGTTELLLEHAVVVAELLLLVQADAVVAESLVLMP